MSYCFRCKETRWLSFFLCFSTVPLTTIRQPLEEMGRIAAKTVVGLIDGQEEYVQEIAVEPKLVVRGSTAAPPQA
jgi:DNA-binding LacI/PurR family transcriptional regulator